MKRLLFILILISSSLATVRAQSIFYDHLNEWEWIMMDYEPNTFFKRRAVYFSALRYDKKYLKKPTFYCEFKDQMLLYYYHPDTEDEVIVKRYDYSIEQGKRSKYFRIYLDRQKNEFLDYNVGITSNGYIVGFYRRNEMK